MCVAEGQFLPHCLLTDGHQLNWEASDNSTFDVQLVTIFDWTNDGEPLPQIPGDQTNPFDFIGADPDGLPSTEFEILAEGFRVLNANLTSTIVSSLAFAPVPDMDPTLEMLSGETRDLLQTAGDLITVSFSPITLAAGEEFIFVVDGTVDDLPTDLAASGRFELLNRPDLAGVQFFVHAESGPAADPAHIGNFTFINTGLFIPEPASWVLFLSGLLTLLLPRRVRRRSPASHRAAT